MGQECVVGLDPSYSCTGIVCLNLQYEVVSYTKLRLEAGPGRLLRAARALHVFIDALDRDGYILNLSVLEDAAYGAISRITVAKLKELTGVYKAIIESHNIRWLDISPSMAKRFISGKGNAEKYVLAEEIKKTYGIHFQQDKGYDLSDAAALAIWGINHLNTGNSKWIK